MLKLTNLRNISLSLFQRQIRSFTANEPNTIVRSWENIPDNNYQYEKISYVVPLKGRLKAKKKKLEFEKLRRKIIERMEQEQSGKSQKVEEVKETDVLFEEEENPTPRKYDRIVGKELYYIPRINNLKAYNDRKIAYLTEFQGDNEIHDERITSLLQAAEKRLTEVLNASVANFQSPEFDASEVQRQDSQVVEALEKLRDLIPKTNEKLYPNIALYLAQNLRYKEDFSGVWEAIEEGAMKNLHNYSTIDIAKMKFALAGTFPKAGSPRLHKALLDIALQDVPTASASELMHLFHAFRLMNRPKIYNKIVEEFLSKGVVFAKNDPEIVANLIYTYANCKIKKHHRSKIRDPIEDVREGNQLLEYLLNDIEAAIPKLSLDGLLRLSLGVMLIRTADFRDIAIKIERIVRKRVAELDAFQTANFIYAFSKMNNGASAGKAAFYTDLEKNVFKYQKEFNDLEKARIFYAYSSRALLSNDLRDKVFLPWIKSHVEHMDYTQLSNVAYGLMFIENTDRDIWRKFARNVSTQKHRCPLLLYAPLKIARFYIEMLFPKWDLSHYEDTCFEAERVFNTNRLENQFEHDEYQAFTRIIKFEVNEEEMRVRLEWENLFIVDFCIPEQNFGILLRKARDCLPDSTEARPIFKLKKKILEANRWTILEIDWNAFGNMGVENRNEWLKAEVTKYKEKTKKNIERNQQERRQEILERMEIYDEEINLNVGREIKNIHF